MRGKKWMSAARVQGKVARAQVHEKWKQKGACKQTGKQLTRREPVVVRRQKKEEAKVRKTAE
jgi:hypothetical protein